MNIYKKQMSLLMTLMLVGVSLLTACGESKKQASIAAKGRYIEEQMLLPTDLQNLLYTDWQDNTYIIYGTDESMAHIFRWATTDGGITWVKDDSPFQELPNTIEWVTNMGKDVEGSLFINYYLNSESGYPVELSRLTEENTEMIYNNFVLNNNVAENAKLLSDGYMAAGYYYNLGLYQTDGTLIKTFTSQDRMKQNSYLMVNEYFAYNDKDKLILINPADGKKLREITIQPPETSDDAEFLLGAPAQTVFFWDEESQSICYANRSGIYQTDKEGNITEKIVDGSLTSLILPSTDIMGLQVQENIFIVQANNENGAPLLFRYVYNPDVLTVPDTQLRIYSLEDTPSIRQAIGAFQQSHPDVMVKYEIGLPVNDSITRSDALKSLATNILAEDGPDLFVLDGLPWESYIEKGVLLELQDIEGDFYAVVADAYAQEGHRYVFPTRFCLPLLLSEKDAVSQVQNPAGLAEYLSKQNNPRLGFEADSIFLEMSRYYSPRWIQENGALNREQFTEDLRAFEKIISQLKALSEPPESVGGDYIVNGLLYGKGSSCLSLASLFAIHNLRGVYTGLQEREGVLTLYPQDEKYFEPKVMIGINAASRQTELAKEFLNCLLSKEQQIIALGDGLPVNKEAMRDNITGGIPESWTYGFSGFDPKIGANEFFIVDTVVPDDAFWQDFQVLLNDMEKPLYIDPDVNSLFIENGYLYLEGQASLDEILSKVEKELILRKNE